MKGLPANTCPHSSPLTSRLSDRLLLYSSSSSGYRNSLMALWLAVLIQQISGFILQLLNHTQSVYPKSKEDVCSEVPSKSHFRWKRSQDLMSKLERVWHQEGKRG
jgi:hypothetical protein